MTVNGHPETNSLRPAVVARQTAQCVRALLARRARRGVPSLQSCLIRDAFFGTAEHVLRGQVHSRPSNHERAAEDILALVLESARSKPSPQRHEADRLSVIDRKLDQLLARPPLTGAP